MIFLRVLANENKQFDVLTLERNTVRIRKNILSGRYISAPRGNSLNYVTVAALVLLFLTRV
jgi:hypothetical protein